MPFKAYLAIHDEFNFLNKKKGEINDKFETKDEDWNLSFMIHSFRVQFRIGNLIIVKLSSFRSTLE